MHLSSAQIASLLMATASDDGRYHLNQDSGVTVATARVLLRRGLVAIDVASAPFPFADPATHWSVYLTRTGLQHRDVWRRYMHQALDVSDESLTARLGEEIKQLLDLPIAV